MKKRTCYFWFTSAINLLALWSVLSNWPWTGFGKHAIKQTHERDTTGKLVKFTEEVQKGKTLWDILQLIGVPAALVYGSFLLNTREKRRAEQREEEEQSRVEANLREEALQAYLDRISELL